MKYPLGTSHGDAGEFFFAYQVAKVLGWPCRLFDIDIGIDAQVEIINDDRSSTGRFVAFQIKATSAEEQNCRYVSKRQLEYWRELQLPVFVVLVDLSAEQMFLHRVRLDKHYPSTPKGAVRIDFDVRSDRFGPASGRAIAEAAKEAALAHVKERLQIVLRGAREIQKTVRSQRDYSDPHALIDKMHSRGELWEALAQAEALVVALRVGDSELSKARGRLEDALAALRGYMEDWNMHRDWDDDGSIAAFFAE